MTKRFETVALTMRPDDSGTEVEFPDHIEHRETGAKPIIRELNAQGWWVSASSWGSDNTGFIIMTREVEQPAEGRESQR